MVTVLRVLLVRMGLRKDIARQYLISHLQRQKRIKSDVSNKKVYLFVPIKMSQIKFLDALLFNIMKNLDLSLFCKRLIIFK